MTDFSTITACGECCVGCSKKIDGLCPGCIEADGHVPEWASQACVRYMPVVRSIMLGSVVCAASSRVISSLS